MSCCRVDGKYRIRHRSSHANAGFSVPSDQGAHRSTARDFAGIRSSLAALGIGYIGYSSNNFWDNMLSAERTTFGQQVYSGQKPTFFTNNVMQMTYDLSRYGISDGQIVVSGVYNFDTWEPGGPNGLSLATLSYYRTSLATTLGFCASSICRR